MWPASVVVDAPVADHDLGFEERIESFAVEQFVAGAAVETIRSTRSAMLSPVDEHGLGAVEAAPVRGRVRDELVAVIERKYFG